MEEHLLALVLKGEVPWDTIAAHVGIDDFSEINKPIAASLAAGVLNLPELMGELDEQGARRASFYALAPLEIDVEQTIEDAKRWMGRLPAIERRLAAIGLEIRASEDAEDWKRWDMLAREKAELLITRKRAKDATMEGIHEQQDDEEGSESEAS